MDTLQHTVPARLRARASSSPTAVAYMFRQSGSDEWQAVTWRSVLDTVDTLSSELVRVGLRAGDRVAIMLPTCPEWEYCQQATLAAGGVVVGLDSHDSDPNLLHVLTLTKPRLLIVQTMAELDRLRALFPSIDIAIVAERSDSLPSGVHGLAELLEAVPASGPSSAPSPQPDDLASIIFTSGSTGQPKGIAYTHRQLVLAIDGLIERFPSVREGDRLVCWLPIANLFQRVLNMFAMSCGATSYFVDKPEEVVPLAPGIRPTLFVGVPRFFEKLHGGLITELSHRPAPARALVRAAWAIGCRHAAAARAGTPPPLWCRLLFPAADRVLARIRALMGANLQFMASGSAPMPRWLLKRLHGLGWIVLEAYGISENVMPIAFNTLQHFRFGSVGKPLPGNELRFADDGELLVRGPGVFQGYYASPTITDALDADGFLHTGDYAHLDADGFLWLDGRKSEIFKTSTGRRVAPVPVEAALQTLDWVDHAVVIGRNRPYPIAILTITPHHRVAVALSEPATRAAIAAEATQACRHFPDYQQPGAFIVSPSPLAVASGELTFNQKIRRTPIENRFRAQIEQAYRRTASQTRKPTPPVIEAP
ncbi:MAG: AMP-binding protein [Proteobacteria bacterium]|nr:AMP-binding protein [Pseudomonadota bacterium]MBS0551135.1 AMP-binding protein [Pseudomonadota bacterium]